MKQLLWVPPPEMVEKALGAEAGGGKPSIMTMEHLGEGEVVWSLKPRVLRGPDDRPKGLLLELDNVVCALSMSRASSLLTWEQAFVFLMSEGKPGPAKMAKQLVDTFGGTIVEVP